MRIVLAMLVVEGAVVEVVLVAILGHGSAWVWVALGLHVYGLIWIGGFLGSLTVLPHEIDDRYLRLRDSVFTTVLVPLVSVVSVEQRRRGSSGRSGWKLDDHGGALLAYGDASVHLVLCRDPGVLLGTAPAPEGLRTIDLTADDPAAFVRAVVAARSAGRLAHDDSTMCSGESCAPDYRMPSSGWFRRLGTGCRWTTSRAVHASRHGVHHDGRSMILRIWPGE